MVDPTFVCEKCGKAYAKVGSLHKHEFWCYRPDPGDYPDDVPARLRALMRARGLSRPALAKRLRCSRSVVDGWVDGVHRPTLKYWTRLSGMDRHLFPRPGIKGAPLVTAARNARWLPPPEWEDTLRDKLSEVVADNDSLLQDAVGREQARLWSGAGTIPTLTSLVRFCRVYGISPSELLGAIGL